MSKIDIDRIVNRTNEKIGFANFKEEESMRKGKVRSIFYFFIGIGILLVGTISVDALTDNSISKAIDSFVKVKVNGSDYNANCQEREDGTMVCEIGDTGSSFEITSEGKNYNYDVDVQTSDEEETVNMVISDK